LKAFYNAKHNPSKPIKIYIQKVLNAKVQLIAMGHKIDDVEVKDAILMNLHPSYDGVKLSFITQPNEPDLATIRSILGSSSPILMSHLLNLSHWRLPWLLNLVEKVVLEGEIWGGQSGIMVGVVWNWSQSLEYQLYTAKGCKG